MKMKVKITTYEERNNMYILKIEKGVETQVEGFDNYNDLHTALLKYLVEAANNKYDYEVEHIIN